MALCPKMNPENPRSATLNVFQRVSHLSGNSWQAQPCIIQQYPAVFTRITGIPNRYPAEARKLACRVTTVGIPVIQVKAAGYCWIITFRGRHLGHLPSRHVPSSIQATLSSSLPRVDRCTGESVAQLLCRRLERLVSSTVQLHK